MKLMLLLNHRGLRELADRLVGSGQGRRRSAARASRRAAKGAFASVLVAAGLTGCAVGPDYERPQVETPSDWRWKVAEPRDHVERGSWWTVFGEPALDRLEATAVSGNLDLQAAFARVEQARATARISRADFYPALNVSGRYTRYRTSGNMPSPVGFPIPSFTLEQFETPLDLSYELDLWGRVRRSFQSARNQALGAEASRQSVLLALQADVAASYFTLKSLDREVTLLDRTVQLRGDALKIFEQRRDAGFLTDFEVQRGRVEVASAEADLEGARRFRATEFNQLAVLCGRAPAEFEVEVPTNTVPLPRIQPDLPSSLLERRPDIAEAERRLAARMAEIGVAKAAFFPVVRLTGAGGYLSGDVDQLFSWDSRTWSFGPTVELPLFSGGRNKAGLERARAAYDESVAQYRQQVLVAFREVEDNLASLSLLEGEVRARREAADSASGAARKAFDRYQAGTVNFLDVVDAEQARLTSLLAHERALRQQKLAAVRLLKALGGGWEASGDGDLAKGK